MWLITALISICLSHEFNTTFCSCPNPFTSDISVSASLEPSGQLLSDYLQAAPGAQVHAGTAFARGWRLHSLLVDQAWGLPGVPFLIYSTVGGVFPEHLRKGMWKCSESL